MELKDFFYFSSKYVGTTYQVYAQNLPVKKRGKSDRCKLIEGDYKNISFPIVFEHEYGTHLRDIIDTGYTSLHLISAQMKQLFEKHQFTGWKTYPVRILDKKGNEVGGYYGFSVTGRCGTLDFSHSRVVEVKNWTEKIVKTLKGYPIGLDKWDGCDFFMPEKYYSIVIAKRVAKVIKENKLTNVALENLDKYIFSAENIQEYLPKD